MADKSDQLILTALSRAAAAAGPVLLHGSKAAPGLFPTSAAGKQAAQRCRDEGYLTLAGEPGASPTGESEPGASAAGGEATATLTRKKTGAQLCSITDKGLCYLLGQVSPREVLVEFVQALEERRTEWGQLTTLARKLLESTETLKANVVRVLDQFPRLDQPGATGSLKALFRDFLGDGLPAARDGVPAASADSWLPLLLEELGRWQGTGSCEDCPLPDLYRQVKAHTPAATIGQFHDALRRLHHEGKVYLHPWTGPLYDLPEPPYALLVGHEIAYYVSVRK